MKRFLNENDKGHVFYGLHFCPGVAQYDEPDKKSFRVFLNEVTIRDMNPTFAGCPVYVDHVEEEDISDKNAVDGWVVESFYNAIDGKTWCKFVAVSERALQRIKQGWKLSNAYIMKGSGPGGVWNGVDYQKEITSGEFKHLAIVPNPRYAESVILTPEQFKQYCDDTRVELARIANSKKQGDKKMSGLKFWNRKPAEDSAELEHISVTLPSSKKEMTILELVNAHDKVVNMHGYANGDHMVKVGDEEMSVNELVDCYGKMVSKNSEDEELKKKNAAEEEEKKKKAENDKKDGDPEEKKENKEELDLAEDKKENKEGPDEMVEDKKKNSMAEALKNAEKLALSNKDPMQVDLDGLERGISRYGSN